MFWIFLQNAGSQLCFRHSLCICPLAIKLYCIVLCCIVLYCISGGGGGLEETRGRTSQGNGGMPEAGAKGARETGELKGARETGELKGAGETGELKGAGETGELKGAGETGELKGAGETGELKGAGETGELFVSSDAGLTYGVFARFWCHRTVLMDFFCDEPGKWRNTRGSSKGHWRDW